MSPEEELQPRFRVDVVGAQGKLVSQERTDNAEEAVRTFFRLSKPEFGKEHGRGSYVALVDDQLRLDASKTYEGFGAYHMRFAKEEGRNAYESIEPPINGYRYPFEPVGARRETAPSEKALRDFPTPPVNEISALQQQATDSAATAARRKAALKALDKDAPLSEADRPETSAIDQLKTDRDTVARMTQSELPLYIEASKQSPKEGREALQAARRRIETESERPLRRPAYPPLEDRFNVVESLTRRVYEFRNEPGKVAFTERWLSMQSSIDSPAVVKAMVDRAEERGWGAVRIDGSEEFKRQAWIAANARRITSVGYEPTRSDRAAAREEQARLEKERSVQPSLSETRAGGSIIRDGAPSRSAVRDEARNAPVMLAFERALDAKGVPQSQRDSAREAVQKQLDAFSQQRKVVKVKLFDPAVQRQAPRTVLTAQQQRAERDRAL